MESRHDLLSAAAAILLLVGVAAWLAVVHDPVMAGLIGAVALGASIVLAGRVRERTAAAHAKPPERHALTPPTRPPKTAG